MLFPNGRMAIGFLIFISFWIKALKGVKINAILQENRRQIELGCNYWPLKRQGRYLLDNWRWKKKKKRRGRWFPMKQILADCRKWTPLRHTTLLL
jgi:hypothetical protein